MKKSECIEKRKTISEILTEEGFVMILDRVSTTLFNTLPRCDELGNVPLIYDLAARKPTFLDVG